VEAADIRSSDAVYEVDSPILEGQRVGMSGYIMLYHAISIHGGSPILVPQIMQVIRLFYSILGLKAMVTTEDFGKPLSTLIWETMFSPWQISVFGLQFVRIELLITC